MLHAVLCIGPLARLDRRFLPLLYNRRHLGVATFCVALLHGGLSLGYYHGFGTLNPIVSLLTADAGGAAVPFEWLGLAALAILFLLASTSHDFWQKALTPAVWKWLHMLIYPAYGLAVMHVATGAMRSTGGIVQAGLLIGGAATVAGLHLVAGFREVRRDVAGPAAGPAADGGGEWLDIGDPAEVPDGRAKTVCVRGRERVAVFRHAGGLSAVSAVCAHQGGPLGEGRILDGCITCPWHGWEYRPSDGCSPPPFAERLPTYRVRIAGGRLLLNPEPLPPGTAVEPARVEEASRGEPA
jgi:nitrite reductase/ring-hydroxylating ferredoxin subunit/DMSO/TMAO reductase YedYZ heme-binding membrane subunit